MFGILAVMLASKLANGFKIANDDYKLKKQSNPNLDYYIDSKGRCRMKDTEKICTMHRDAYGNKKLVDSLTLEVIHDYEKEKLSTTTDENKKQATKNGKDFYVIGNPSEYRQYKGTKYGNINNNNVYVIKSLGSTKSYYINIKNGEIGRVTYTTESYEDRNESRLIEFYKKRIATEKVDRFFINGLKNGIVERI